MRMQFEDNYPLKNVTALKIGGPAKKFVSINTIDELKEAINYAKQNRMEFLVIGGGSNLLVNDKGVDKLIIKNEIVEITTSKVGPDSFEVKVKSGTVLQELVDYTIEHGLSGLHKMTGIPGTVGGAVYGNAGAYGQTISDHIVEVTTINPSVIPASEPESIQIYGSRVKPAPSEVEGYGMTKEACEFNYRDSVFKRNHFIILEVTFQLEKGDTKTLQQEAGEVLQKRLIKYPPGIKCPGSFFKNIVADTLPKKILDKIPSEKIVYGKLPAGALLEEVGAKGDSLDGIYIADYHANLFVNNGGGSAKAFYDLAKKYADKVYQKFGIKLEPEVQLINLPTF
ncbi:UDP-N-acetylmuramate dehydrogenase [Candidatus Daviesbacteria bacterium]|nr:UDP-N-acetylmuramate dehydrogenase [Candidatus Daviesbacteria bacterium]